MRKISKLFFLITALSFALSFGVVSNSPTVYATSGGNENSCSDFTEASDRDMCNDQYSECQAATGGNNCMERAVTYTQDNGTQAENGEGAVCSAGALGWVLCPLNEAMVAMLEGIGALLEGFLTFQPLTNSDQGDAIRAIWGSVLAIANSGLVIVFLIVIFSQATSIGLSSYGIKKLLPRIIAAAILMNLSFYICAIAVDLSNILGVSVKAIVEVGIQQVGTVDNPDLQQGAGIGQWIAVIATTLLAAGIAAATGAIFLLVPVLISGVMAALTALIIIAARQVLITLLIIIAPLAILAWILPNTEQWFTKWRKLMTTLLLMFPMIMAIFYGAVLVSNVTLLASTQGDSSLNDFTINLLAFLVLIVPLFSIPFVIKSAGGVLDRLGVIANNRNRGAVDRSRKWAQGQAQRTREGNMARGVKMRSWGEGQSGVGGKLKRGVGKSANFVGGYEARRDSKRAGLKADADRIQQDAVADLLQNESSSFAKRSTLRGESGQAIARARGIAIQDKMIGEEMSAAKTVIENMGLENKQVWKLASHGTATNMNGQVLSGDLYQKAAQSMMLSQGQMPAVESMVANAHNMSKGVQDSLIYNIAQNYPTLKAKAHGYNDDSIKQLINNGQRVDDHDIEMATGSKVSGLTKEQFAAQDPASLKRALQGVESGYIRGDQRSNILKLASDAASDKNLAKSFSVEATTHLNGLLSQQSAAQPPMPNDYQDRIDRNKAYSNNQTPGPGNSGGSTPPPSPPSGGSSGSPAAPRGPSGPPPAAPLGYAPAPQATAAPTPPPAQVVQTSVQQTSAPAAPARNLPPVQQATITPDAPRYTSPYSQSDLQAMGSGGIRTIIREVPQGAQGLSNADIAKIINATQDQAAMQDINQELRMERNRRRGGFDPTSGPQNPLP